jgi:hypothetical protein
MKTMKKAFYCAIFLLITSVQTHTVLVTGDPLAADGETFSFDVGFAAFDSGSETSNARLWTATNDPDMATKADTVKPYGLSLINQYAAFNAVGATPSATAMTNQEAATVYTFDGTTASATTVDPNPLWGAQFQLFSAPAQKPVFVLASQLSRLYAVEDIQRYPDNSKPNVTTLTAYDFANDQQIAAIFGYGLTYIYAAHATGAFGTNPSKIALLSKTTQVTNGVSVPYFSLIADTTISTATSALNGGGTALQALGSSVALGFAFGSFYIGVDATASGVAGSCALAMTYATLTATDGVYSFVYNQIAPTSLVSNGADTVISAAAGNEIIINQIAPLSTSTGLQYLVFAREDGSDDKPVVYALPVVAGGADMGKIADFRSVTNVYGRNPNTFISRSFTSVVSDADDLDPAGDYSAQLIVGTDSLPSVPEFPIQQLYTVGDSVYVTLGDTTDEAIPYGTFHSQAIFAQDGHIIGWSEWEQVLGSEQSMNYSTVDRKTISGFYVSHKTGGTNYRAIQQTMFNYNSFIAPLLNFAPAGGIQGLFNFGSETPGFNCSFSLMISTAYNQVCFGQTGTNNGGFHSILNPVETATYSGDAVNNQQALIAAEIAHAAPSHFIFVGGANGVSVLTGDTTGYTWANNLNDISNLQPADGFTFKTVGNFSSVKKLVWDSSSTYLYVLTSTQLYRIALDPNKFKLAPTEDLDAQLLLSATDLAKTPAYFLDILIDNGFCILGTTNGLYTIDFSEKISIKKITIPSGLPAASQLITVSSNAEPHRVFKDSSNLFVLNNTFGTQQARINRFVITDGVLAPFDDFLIANPTSNPSQGIATSFIKFDNYINNYFTDGSWNLASSYFLGITQPSNSTPSPSVLQLFTGIRAGFSSSQLILPSFSGYAPLTFITNSFSNMAGFVRETTSGALIAYGNFSSLANT